MVTEISNAKDEPRSPLKSSSEVVDLILVQSLKVTIDESSGQLSVPQTNHPAELSFPREIISSRGMEVISSSVSSSILQSELLRPIIAGTFRDAPAYLVRLQFQLVVPSGTRSWLSRIQTASINVLLKDAPLDLQDGLMDDEDDDERLHPSVVKTFPGPNGWEGKPSTAEVTETKDIGLQLGWDAVAVSAKMGESRTKTETGAIKVMAVRKGRQRNSLLMTIAEDPVDRAGIPAYLTIPLIITHNTRRFSMRVAVNARFGFWRGKLAEIVPVLGRADEPLYFDPLEMSRMMEKGQRGTGGVQVVEWRGKLDNIDLREYCSLTGKSDLS